MSYIKLHRKLLYSECFKKPEHLKLWIYCLLRANHEDKVITHGGKLVKVLRGSFITGRHKMSEDTGISERKIRTFLESKKETNDLNQLMMTIMSRPHHSRCRCYYHLLQESHRPLHIPCRVYPCIRCIPPESVESMRRSRSSFPFN